MVEDKELELWNSFKVSEGLEDTVLDQFKQYHDLLKEWNEQINLTAITETKSIIRDHFQDSLYIDRFIPFNTIHGIVDVGSGAGLPGIPLKIKHPHIPVILIEVTNKKIDFLKHVIQELGLQDIEIYPLDWRTFLRTTNSEIMDLFVSRASLQPEELIRMFKPSCSYNKAQLVYWASFTWQPTLKEKPHIREEKEYVIGHKKRKYIFFTA